MDDHPAFDERDTHLPAVDEPPERSQNRGIDLHAVPCTTGADAADECVVNGCVPADATGVVLSRAFRAAFCASLPRSPLPESLEDVRDLVLGAAQSATIRVISDLRRMGSGPEAFPVEDAQAFIEDILHGDRALPGLGRIAANTVYAGLLASLPTDSGGVE